jgi:hypothetical protein
VGTSARFVSEIAGLKSLDNLDWESYGGAHHVATEAASEVNALAEAKSRMY